MNASVECIYCILDKIDNLFCKVINDEEERLTFTKQILKEISSYDNDATAPFLNSRVMRVLKDRIGVEDLYAKEKEEYNKMMLGLETEIFNSINASEDKLLSGLKYAMVGNFIDFGAMDNIDDELLNKIIETALKQKIDLSLYKEFKKEILGAKKLCYIVDNTGEVVFDKLFIKSIKEANKNINVDIIVRGEPILNDVTYKEAIDVGIHKYGNIIENGTDIAGTDLSQVNEETLNSIESSDLIISKGQGNFETLFGCDYNIYYIFLCKCSMFAKRFSMEKYSGVFMK